MEALVAQVVALSNPNDLSQLLSTLKGSDAVFTQNYQHIAAALQALDPAQHSLGFAFFLHHLAKGNLHVPDVGFIDNASRFFMACDSPQAAAQIRLAPDIFYSAARKLKEHVLASNCPRRGVLPLRSAVRALQPRPEVLTPLHGDLFQLCLLSRCYNAACCVLDDDILDVAPQQTGCIPTDLFLYCYYGGMLCIGRKQYPRALELLLQAVTAPAVAGNAIVAAAYKKYVLVCLIHAGGLLHLPKYTSSCVRHVIDSEARPYNELASAYASRNADRLRRVADQHTATFAADNNLGLVRQVVASLAVRSIQRLTQTFLTLSLTDIAAHAGLPGAEEAEARILRMVAAGQIHAKIDGRTGMVRFADETRAATGAAASSSASRSTSGLTLGGGGGVVGGGGVWDSAAGVAALDERMRLVLELGKRLQQANEMVSQDRAYLSKVTARERSKYDMGASGGASGLGGGLGGAGGVGAEQDFGPFAVGGGGSL
ncbi:hypothetical protein PLESTB_000699900 [Pleodorina starrii]|uniref:COP9 signalosome complex subunit 3 n=1 Tax=Pleodorina starrii TaxID=330485 RepID=A0A9W6F1Q1_9CHLO|nr:hypothetical protein PLESTM_001216900 [Pleodorina starrii]GLC53024.1 hypothetical protein PLESTB_000699900 [Pleodorina starrii]GLC75028.1 hypothetical protein PLESTF_001585200 [Pleodorina starrii]